ncbi:MAG TPA: MMPL family transporter, partial [Steroidobacteraceae bacterium]|nr:MMPL family transporter [Steroidobacteraceae bacterium]
MPHARARIALTVGWVAVLALLGLYVQRNLEIGTDLRLFMPSPQTPAERLLLEEVGESPASRLLLVAIEGAPPESLAETSQSLAAALREDPSFRFIANGEASMEAIPERLLPYRYLLSSTLDRQRFDAPFLRVELEQRERDLTSPAASALEPILPRDPTLELLKLAEAWQPSREPQRLYDVWFDSQGDTALMLVETVAAAFDPEGQRHALDALRAHFEHARSDPAARLIVSGPGAFSVLMRDRTAGEAQWLGALATAGMIVLLLIAYRTPSFLLLGALPIASAGLAGLAAVSAVFGALHGITLAFGFTLIGVAQDYPLHVFSHRKPGEAPVQTARSVWPPLATGVASTCIAYLAFLRSGVTGLAQLATFTIAGLAIAGLTTRYLLPRVLPDESRDYGNSAVLGRLWSLIAGLPQPKWLGLALAAASVLVIALAPGPMWQNDLGKLTPVPQQLLRQDDALRRELGAPDVRHLLVISGQSADAVLARAEQLNAELDALV